MQLDETHDPARRSWVASADGHADFPIQNLPFGTFAPKEGAARGGVAIGDMILDLDALHGAGLVNGIAADGLQAAREGKLNAFFAMGSGPRKALRHSLSKLLSEGHADASSLGKMLHRATECTMHMPAAIGDYTDFYVGIHHATAIGEQFRPDNPLLPNYKYVPIGYHGRASTIVPSGTPIKRPNGQRKLPDEATPTFGPTRRLDYELELGIWVGSGNQLGHAIPISGAGDHVAGFCLLNDWSARDIQAWEYQPLGPFLSKNFGSVLSAWVITPEALAPFRIAQPARPAGDPAPLPYLYDAADQEGGGFDIELEVFIVTPGLRDKGLPPHRLSVSNARFMYWTVAQMITHHTCNGCALQPGDLLGSGTISGPDDASRGSLLETTKGGRHLLQLASGEERGFVEDGDEIWLQARAKRNGFATIGFGDCRGPIAPALAVN